MTDHSPSPSPMRPSRRTALKALGGTVVSGGVAATPTGTAAASAPGRIPRDLRPGGALDRLVADLAAEDRFSGSLLLTCQGRTVLSRSHGMADKAAGVRNGPETRFALASVTKLFTATAVHRLVQEGRLSYTDTVGAHLDGFPPEVATKVTIHHMLTHTSGLGDVFTLPGYPEESMTWTSADAVLNGTVDFIRKTRPAFPPGAGHLYSNAAVCLLGAIIAAVSRRPYYDYVAEHVFEAAGMRDSAFHTKPQCRSDPRIARPYARNPGEPHRTDNLEKGLFIGLPAGDSHATCADMERFAHALLDDDLLDAPYTDLMLGAKVPLPPRNPPTPSSAGFAGYGPVTSLSHGRWVHGHGGGNLLGASTSLDIVPASGWVIVVLSNYEAGTVEPIATLARRLVLDA
ncbi:beta-lactamase family protein [Actinomadura graeca]|uniref:Beta-lactamase family protein n=1 Tax=Actinomadura graeca TaxID=2750812 RepID=A0ABX8R0I6_9ACTN|nr:serine hydrolase domain-containing protein [Actinomadura graeca]QXJ24570.1 beta-lactamase family protein [Actinomadura graeca]